MRNAVMLAVIALGALGHSARAEYPDRFVWIFGWGLRNDGELSEIDNVLETAQQHGLNGAVVSLGLDRLSQRDEAYLRRLDALQQAMNRRQIELIPSIFSVGYGGAFLAHNRNLAEGLPVRDALLDVRRGEARLAPDPSVRLLNGGFEEYEGQRVTGYRFHDEPGKVSFPDVHVAHGGRASLRFENFGDDPAGHARAMQEVKVRPWRCYRVSLWVKTENLEPAGNFRLLALADGRNLAPRSFRLAPTADWRKVTMLLNSLHYETVRLYAGVWGGRAGRFWIDDWTLEEVGPINVLHRPGTPVTVTSEDGSIVYREGEDYAPLEDPNFNFRNVDRPSAPLKIPPSSRIRDGQRLHVSWYHPMVVNDSQITVCMAEPQVYEIMEQEAKLLVERLHPRRVLLSMDEVRMGGSCKACEGRNMGELLGECVTRQVRILRRLDPRMEIYIWSDMLDPNHNAHDGYYLVQGDLTGSWRHIPKDLVIAVWGGTPREKSLQFFAGESFQTLVACYYDADTLSGVQGWMELAKGTAGVRGFMYTPWRKKYGLLGRFGDLLREP